MFASISKLAQLVNKLMLMFINSKVNDRPRVIVLPVVLDKCQFYCGNVMQKQWTENNTIFLDCVTAKYGQNVKASLVASELVVIEVDERLLPKLK